jgi:hypothetical protein
VATLSAKKPSISSKEQVTRIRFPWVIENLCACGSGRVVKRGTNGFGGGEVHLRRCVEDALYDLRR